MQDIAKFFRVFSALAINATKSRCFFEVTFARLRRSTYSSLQVGRPKSKAGEDGQAALAEPTPADLAHGFCSRWASLDEMSLIRGRVSNKAPGHIRPEFFA
jgi:hypothetical protein